MSGKEEMILRRSIPGNLLVEKAALLISQGYRVTITVRGNSMNPFICDHRDCVVLTPFTAADLCRGTVVLARCGEGQMVLHRIIACRRGILTLMGDGNVGQTETCTVSDVLGVVSEVIRKGETYSCHGVVWTVYSRVWTALRPLRRYLLGGWRRMGRGIE